MVQQLSGEAVSPVELESLQNMSLQLSHTLTSKARKFFIYEWFYPAIDFVFFEENEFMQCLEESGVNVSFVVSKTNKC